MWSKKEKFCPLLPPPKINIHACISHFRFIKKQSSVNSDYCTLIIFLAALSRDQNILVIMLEDKQLNASYKVCVWVVVKP